jgi:hypothetical protein
MELTYDKNKRFRRLSHRGRRPRRPCLPIRRREDRREFGAGHQLFQRYGKGGDNPELKNWANKNPADAARPPENGARPRQVMQPRIA